MIITIDTDDKVGLLMIVRRMFREHRKIKEWHQIDNPEGPTGTLEQRRVERMRRALKISLEDVKP